MTLTNCVQTRHTLAVITRIFLASQLCFFAFPARWHWRSKPLTSDWWIPWRFYCTCPLAIKNGHGKSAKDGLVGASSINESFSMLHWYVWLAQVSRLESSWPWDLWERDTNECRKNTPGCEWCWVYPIAIYPKLPDINKKRPLTDWLMAITYNVVMISGVNLPAADMSMAGTIVLWKIRCSRSSLGSIKWHQ